jgi:hypothetical protein
MNIKANEVCKIVNNAYEKKNMEWSTSILRLPVLVTAYIRVYQTVVRPPLFSGTGS